MTQHTPIHPLISPWGRFGLYSYFIDAPEPAIVDTGIASSPAEGMAPALEKLGRRIQDVRWILLTHGHIDHVGGAFALWELTGRRAKVVIHKADAKFVRSRRAHLEEYLGGRAHYLNHPDGASKQLATAYAAISGELEPDILLNGGEVIPLGGGVTVTAHHLPGHTEGAVAYVVNGQNDVFVGDAVQLHGAANGFPGYENAAAYRASLLYLRDEVRPQHLYLGHPYRGADGVPYGVELDSAAAQRALGESLDIEARIRVTAYEYLRSGPQPTASVYSPFEPVAEQLGYTGDPTLEPAPFFTTMHAYRTRREAERSTPRKFPSKEHHVEQD